jgi:endonuclease YncB( thermonuclease family)
MNIKMNELKKEFLQQGNDTPFFSLNGISCFCRIIDILDGDTVTVILPINDIYYKFIIRLNGIDTCETKSKDQSIRDLGMKAKKYIFELLCNKNNIIMTIDINICSKKDIKTFLNENLILCYIKCHNFDKFGRTLADLYLNSTEDISLSQILLNKKLAYPYFGDKKSSNNELKDYFNIN